MQAVDCPHRTLKFVPIFEFRNYPDAYLSKPTDLRPTHTTSGQRVKQSRLFSLIFTSVFSDFHFSFHWLSLLFSLTFTSLFIDFHFSFHWLSLQFSLTFTSIFTDFHFNFHWLSLLFSLTFTSLLTDLHFSLTVNTGGQYFHWKYCPPVFSKTGNSDSTESRGTNSDSIVGPSWICTWESWVFRCGGFFGGVDL